MKIGFQPSMFVCFFLLYVCIVFSFCLSRAFYVHAVQGVCSWCVHVCSWCAHVYGECRCMLCFAFACWLKYCFRLKIDFSAKYVCMSFFALRLDFFCFSFCLSRVFYVHLFKVYVPGLRMYVLGVRMFMVSVGACFALLLHVD